MHTAVPKGLATVNPVTTTTYNATATAADGSTITASATVTVSAGNSGVIKHIFFLLQENRSFDMYFGRLGAYRRGRLAQFNITDTQTVDSFNPNVTLTNSHTGVTVAPFHELTECTENLSPS
jgi:phospholipase C